MLELIAARSSTEADHDVLMGNVGIEGGLVESTEIASTYTGLGFLVDLTSLLNAG